jgi:hypothetical protein
MKIVRAYMIIMDYRVSSAPRLAFRLPGATAGNDETGTLFPFSA